jgi:hypothetical protein
MEGPVHDAPATEGRDAPAAAQLCPRAGYVWAMLLARIYESQAQEWACLARQRARPEHEFDQRVSW